jgi:glycosyltransferase involved in cell wall biosynthesis
MSPSVDCPVIVDGLVFALQRAGGISRVWSTLLDQLKLKIPELVYFEPKEAARNIYRAELAISPAALEPWSSHSKFLPQRLFSGRCVYVPTYYRPGRQDQRCIQICHDTIREESIGQTWLPALKLRRRHIYTQAAKIICVSQATREDLRRHYGEEVHRKSVVIPNPVDSARLLGLTKSTTSQYRQVWADAPVALYIGKRDGAKNFRESVLLLENTRQEGLRLAVVGPPLTPEEQSLLAPFGQRVCQLGQVPDHILAQAIADAAFLFLPSIKEGFGFPTVEALCLGTPVVCIDNAINREVSLGLAQFYISNTGDSLRSAALAALDRSLTSQEVASVRETYAPAAIASGYLKHIHDVA